MKQLQPLSSAANRNHGFAFSAIWRTLGLGISLTMIGSMVLAVVFAFALDGCSRVATRIKPHTAPAAAAAGERPHSAIAAIAG